MRLSYRGFTIVELLGAIIIISIALLSILGLLRVAVSYTNKTRQETIAINLAREGMEGMYTRRNTNWLKRSGEKDKHRLCIDNDCSEWFTKNSIYKLDSHNNSFGKEIIFKRTFNLMTPGEPIRNGDSYYPGPSIIVDYTTPFTKNNQLLLESLDFLGGISPDSAGKFYRGIVGLGLYQKDSNDAGGYSIDCINGDSDYIPKNIGGGTEPGSKCGDNHPKEFRFCSRVEYEKQFKGKVELCGAITNYQE